MNLKHVTKIDDDLFNDDEFIKLVQSIASKYSVKGNSNEDLLQECLTKMWEVRDKFNPERGALTTFTYNVLTNHLSTLANLESNTMNSNHIIVNGVDKILKDTKNYDLRFHIEDSLLSPAENDTLLSLLSIARKDKVNEYIVNELLKGNYPANISKALNVSRQAVDQRLKKMIKELREGKYAK